MNHWLIKQEPTSYSWDDFVKDGKTAWTGVRNYMARNNLQAMRKGDRAFYYHSVVGKAVMGEAEVVREAYPDPTAKEDGWVCVDVKPLKALPRPVALDEIKQDAALKNMVLLRNSRLSVQPVTAAEYKAVLALAKK